MIEMNDIPKLKEFTVEELQKQLKDKKIDKEFLIEYIVKRDRVYNKLIDKIEELQNDLDAANSRAKELSERIIKAIEYIEKYSWQEDIVGNTCSGEPMIDRYMRLEWDNCNELLKILKGEPNNE